MIILKNSINSKELVPMGDENNLPSMTEPDQTLSIKQLIEKHVQGVNLGVKEYEPFYTDEELPNFEFMDLEEIHSYRQHLSEERYRLEDELQRRKQEDLDAKRKAQTPNGSAADTDAGGTGLPTTKQPFAQDIP